MGDVDRVDVVWSGVVWCGVGWDGMGWGAVLCLGID